MIEKGMGLDAESIQELMAEARASGFKDRRLCERLANIFEKVGAAPSLSFPRVFSPAELEGAYRFFGNPVVTSEGILSGHYASLRERVSREETVLVVHDTSPFAFDPDGEREGLGRIRTRGQAFLGHFALVVSADGQRHPLGVAGLKTWVRADKEETEEAKENKETEKARWRCGIGAAGARLDDPSRALHVADREADDYALFAYCVQNKHRFLFRLMHDRVLEQELGKAVKRISDMTSQMECAVERSTKLSKRVDGSRSPTQKKTHPSRAARVAQLAIGALPLELPRPRSQRDDLPERLMLNLVRVWELNPPEGEEPVEWLLLTNEPAATADDLNRLVDAYRARWRIEEFFNALKTGCSFLQRQLEDYEGLVNALAVSAPIACHALALRSRARQQPESTEPLVIETDELLVLRAKGRIKLPSQPTNRDILLAVAAMGGHIKWNGEPGWKTICRGLEKLSTITEGFRLAKLQPASDQ